MEWRVIPGFENYKVNRNGDVFSLRKNRLMKQWQHQNGYMIIDLTRNCTRYHKRVHRLVMLAFAGDPPQGKNDVNHKNGNKEDNRLENLEYCSRSENLKHRHERLGYKSPRGKRDHCLTDTEINEIRAMHQSKKYTLKQLCDIWKLSQGGLSGIIYKCGIYKNRGD